VLIVRAGAGIVGFEPGAVAHPDQVLAVRYAAQLTRAVRNRWHVDR